MNFQEKLDDLAIDALGSAIRGDETYYTSTDLVNAVLVFNEVVMSRIWNFQKDKLNQAQLEQLAVEYGTSLHQIILLFTGDDLHECVKNPD